MRLHEWKERLADRIVPPVPQKNFWTDPYRFNLQEDPMEQFPGAERLGRIPSRKSRDVKRSILGIGFETLDRDTFDPRATFPFLAESGVKYARCQTGWMKCERVPGRYDFLWLDEVVNPLAEIGIETWFSLSFGHPVHTPAEAYEAAWRKAGGKLVPWNEPWLPLFFHKSYDPATRQYRTCGSLRDNAEAYARLSKLACLGAKKGNPDCRITAFSSSRGSTPAWNAALYAADGYTFCDEIDYHTYHQNAPAGFPGDGLEETMRLSFSEVLRREGVIRKPVLMSEGQSGYATADEGDPRTGMYKHTIPWRSGENYHRIAEAEIRFLLSHLTFGVKRVFLYTSHAYSNLAQGSQLQIMLGADGFPHPGLVAMSAFARRIEGKKFVRWQKLADGVFAALFSDGKQTVAVLTGEPEKKAEILCTGTFPHRFADLYGNPLPRLSYRGELLYLTADCPPELLRTHLRAESPLPGQPKPKTNSIE